MTASLSRVTRQEVGPRLRASDRPRPTGAGDDTLPLLYIGGWGRSGSTLLARMLGQLDGLVYIGEVRDLWLRGGIENRLCGCGDAFGSCAFWSAVGRAAFGGWDRVSFADMLALRAVADRPWRVPQLLRTPPSTPLSRTRRRGDRYERAVSRYGELLERLYRAVLDVSEARVVVDSSKVPSFALILSRMREADVRVVHLVRDSRGTVHSWQKRVVLPDTPGQRTMIRYSAAAAAARYLLYNAQTHLVRRAGLPYMFLRYEDLIRDPSANLLRVLRHGGALTERTERQIDEVVRGRRVRLGANHSVIGNPMRLATGDLELRADRAWAERMSPWHHAVVTTVTSPLLLRYHYPLGRR